MWKDRTAYKLFVANFAPPFFSLPHSSQFRFANLLFIHHNRGRVPWRRSSFRLSPSTSIKDPDPANKKACQSLYTYRPSRLGRSVYTVHQIVRKRRTMMPHQHSATKRGRWRKNWLIKMDGQQCFVQDLCPQSRCRMEKKTRHPYDFLGVCACMNVSSLFGAQGVKPTLVHNHLKIKVITCNERICSRKECFGTTGFFSSLPLRIKIRIGVAMFWCRNLLQPLRFFDRVITSVAPSASGHGPIRMGGFYKLNVVSCPSSTSSENVANDRRADQFRGMLSLWE